MQWQSCLSTSALCLWLSSTGCFNSKLLCYQNVFIFTKLKTEMYMLTCTQHVLVAVHNGSSGLPAASCPCPPSHKATIAFSVSQFLILTQSSQYSWTTSRWWSTYDDTRVWRIYLNIRIYWSRIYIRTFVRINFSFTNIFGHSFVSNLFVRIYSDIRWWVC